VTVLQTCARDKSITAGGEPSKAEAVEIVMRYTLEGDLALQTQESNGLFYFFIFNFSNSPKTDEDSRPQPLVSGDDRGANWERYVVFHGPSRTTDNVLTLQRKDIPKLISVGREPVDVIAFDADGDSFLDLATANRGDDSVSVILGAGDGSFKPAEEYSVGDEPVRLANVDYDGDGDQDLVVSNFGDSAEGKSLTILLNDGTGSFAEHENIVLPAQPMAVSASDFNADGRMDIAVSLYTDSAEGNKVAILLGNDEGFSEPVFYTVGKNPVDIAVADVNIDGISDLLVVNGYDGDGGNSVSILYGKGDGSFEDSEISLSTGRAPSSISVAMINTDPYPDFVVANSFDGEGGNSVSVFLSDESGVYNEVEKVAVGRVPTHVILFDLNRDGIADLLVTENHNSAEGNRIRRFLGSGDGSFTEPVPAPTGRMPVRSALIDFNNDGLLDLAVANSFDGSDGNSISLLDGTEDATFQGALIHWTDDPPLPIVNEPWFRGITIGRNYLELRIDPAQFTDLLGNRPDSFLLDFLVATTGIDRDTNPEDFGDELDWLLRPIVVEVEPGFETDEERQRLEDPSNENTPQLPPPEANIVDWRVEVK